MGCDPFTDLLTNLGQVHSQQLQELRDQIESLQAEVSQLRPSAAQANVGFTEEPSFIEETRPSPARANVGITEVAQDDANANSTDGAWRRLVLSVTVIEETRIRLCFAETQQKKQGFSSGADCLGQASRLLSGAHGAASAAQAYDWLYTCPKEARQLTQMWKALAVCLRTNVVLRCWCHEGSGELIAVEAALVRLYGSERLSKQGDRLFRSQLFLAHEQLVHICFGRGKSSRPKRQRGRHPNGVMPDVAIEQATSSAQPRLIVSAEDAAAFPQFLDPSKISVHNTFISGFDDDSEDRLSQGKESCKSWPRTHPTTATEKKKRERELSKLLQNLIDSHLPPEECSSQAESLKLLLNELPLLAETEPLVHVARCHASNAVALRNILGALQKVAGHNYLEPMQLLLEDFRDSQPLAVAECCATLGHFAMDTYGRLAANEVVGMLLAAMQQHCEHADVQLASMDSLLLIHRDRAEVFGFCCARETLETFAPLSEALHVDFGRIVAAAGARHEQCNELAVKLLVRTHHSELLRGMAISDRLTEAALEEIYFNLQEPLTTCGESPEAECGTPSRILRQLARQLSGPFSSPHVLSWVRKNTWQTEMQPRLLLHGVLSGAAEGIVQPMKWAAEIKDEDLMTAAFRAIYVFNDYVLEVAPEVRDQLNALVIVLNQKSLTLRKGLRSAIAGALGSLNRGRGTASGGVIEVLLCLASRSMVLWQREASVHHEVLWALNEIFAGQSMGQWGVQIRQLAKNLAGNWQHVHEQDSQKTGEIREGAKDEAMVVELASKLLHAGSPELSSWQALFRSLGAEVGDGQESWQ